jgi:hypothetical protein
MLHVVDSPGQSLRPAAPSAIVTVVLGDEYQAVWQRAARRSWEAYGRIHGLDVIVVTAPLDDAAGGRSPAWQKCLVLSQPWSSQYRRIVWLDADIVINEAAPSILDHCGAPDRVSATLVNDQLSSAQKQILLERIQGIVIPPGQADSRWGETQNLVYTSHGIATDRTDMVATGVMVLSPEHHRSLLEGVYAKPESGRAYEQAWLSHAILSQGLLHRLSARFNWGLWDAIWLERKGQWGEMNEDRLAFVMNELDKAYFLHFYVVFEAMKALEARP